jgi:hypothetical protein
VLISQREACEVLTGAEVSRRHAQRALACGLAGNPIRTRSALLYDEAAVWALASRTILLRAHMWRRSPAGFFVARRDVAAHAPREAQLHELATGWEAVSPWTWVGLSLRVDRLVQERGRGLPFVCTVAGFVVLGAEIVSARGRRLELVDPGAWFDGLGDARLLLGPGQAWSIHLDRCGDDPRERIAG